MNATEKVINKLKKLLRLSGSSEVGEAEAALKAAQELAARHDLDLSSISVTEAEQSFGKEEKYAGLELLPTQKFVTWILTEFFEVQIISTRQKGRGWTLNFIGRKDKIENALYLNEFLNNTFASLWRMYLLKADRQPKDKETYLYGVYAGLSEVLERNKRELQAREAGYGMVLATNEKKLKLALDQFFPNLKWTKTRIKATSNEVLERGRLDGRQINLHRGELK